MEARPGRPPKRRYLNPVPVFRPPSYDTIEGPLVFLAGPIQGARAWQDEAASLLEGLRPGLAVASPRRLHFDRLDSAGYAAQVDWEGFHLRRAAAQGVILFWLARELEHDPGRAYAQTTRFELAEWATRRALGEPVQLVVGVEDGFPGARYIRYRLASEDVPLVASLEETCRLAVSKLPSPD